MIGYRQIVLISPVDIVLVPFSAHVYRDAISSYLLATLSDFGYMQSASRSRSQDEKKK